RPPLGTESVDLRVRQVGELRRQSGRRLVDEEDGGIGHQQAGNLEEALLPAAQAARMPVAHRRECWVAVEGRLQRGPDSGPLGSDVPRPDEQVLVDGETRKGGASLREEADAQLE